LRRGADVTGPASDAERSADEDPPADDEPDAGAPDVAVVPDVTVRPDGSGELLTSLRSAGLSFSAV